MTFDDQMSLRLRRPMAISGPPQSGDVSSAVWTSAIKLIAWTCLDASQSGFYFWILALEVPTKQSWNKPHQHKPQSSSVLKHGESCCFLMDRGKLRRIGSAGIFASENTKRPWHVSTDSLFHLVSSFHLVSHPHRSCKGAQYLVRVTKKCDMFSQDMRTGTAGTGSWHRTSTDTNWNLPPFRLIARPRWNKEGWRVQRHVLKKTSTRSMEFPTQTKTQRSYRYCSIKSQ